MVVQHNIPAMNANRLYGINNSGLSKSLEKLSSGYAINRAGDNAAGLAVSEKMRAQISGLTQASKNAEDGISMVQTFEGALQETDSILQRMRTLAVQSANGTYQNDVDREAIQLEYDQLNDELNQIADTDFNGVVVLNGGQMADGLKAVNGEFKYDANAERTTAMQWGNSDINDLDATKYDDTSAAKLWTDLGLDNKEVDSVNITFKYDKNAEKWTIDDASDATALAKAKAGGITIEKANGTDKNNGGFSIKTDTDTVEVANVVLDATKLADGDTVTLNFKNPVNKTSAPENAGVDSNSIVTNIKSGNKFTAAPTVALTTTAAGYKSTNNTTAAVEMTESAAKAFNGLEGAKFDVTYTEGKVSKLVMTLADGTSKTLDTSAADATGTITAEDGTAYSLTATKDTGALAIKDKDGVTLLTVTPSTGDATTANKKTNGTQSFTISLDKATFDAKNKPTASVVDPKLDGKVSKSNSNDASTATLTYTDNVTLQVGARTKDSVNFTFQYESKGLGDLKADLDCSARGLGTDQLSLATQSDANGAIDKIDNAINKVSMVRASFGAMQNRLEHKIANLDTNNENLTAAESRIRDTDMAEEMTNFTKNQILAQASQAMLAQANQLPQGVLQLLG